MHLSMRRYFFSAVGRTDASEDVELLTVEKGHQSDS